MLSFFNCCKDLNEIDNDEDYFENIIEINTNIKYNELIKIITENIFLNSQHNFYTINTEIFYSNETNINLITIYNLDILKIKINLQNLYNETLITIEKIWGDNNDYNKLIDYLLNTEKKLQINTNKNINLDEIINLIENGTHLDKILNSKILANYYINNGYILNSYLEKIINLLNSDLYFVNGYICITLFNIFKNNKNNRDINIEKHINILKLYETKINTIKILNNDIKINNNTNTDIIISIFMSHMASMLLNYIKLY
jgi:hypothetical protein